MPDRQLDLVEAAARGFAQGLISVTGGAATTASTQQVTSTTTGLPGTAWIYAPDPAAISRVRGFPPGEVERLMQLAVLRFNRRFNRDVVIERISFHGTVVDRVQSADEMLRTLAILDQDANNPSAPITVATIDDVARHVPRAEVNRLWNSMYSNVAIRDYLVIIELKETRTGRSIETVNSMSPDGRTFSGTFFMTTAEPEAGRLFRVVRPNTQCETELVATYWWLDRPAITIDGCVRAICQGQNVVDCKIMRIAVSNNLFAEVETLPSGRGPHPGDIVGNRCDGTIAYAWASGFKKVKIEVNADGVAIKLEVEGRIGRGNNGFFTVTERCESVPVISGIGIDSGSSSEVSCATIFPMLPKCDEVDISYDLDSFEELEDAVRRGAKLKPNAPLRSEEEIQTDEGDYPGVGLHYSFFNDRAGGEHVGGGFGIRCCRDTDGGPDTSKMKYKYSG